MWTKTTLRLSETNTPAQSSLWMFLTRLVYFALQRKALSSVNLRYPTSPADKYVDSMVSVDTKRVVDGEPWITSPPLNILWRGSLCACYGVKGQYSLSAADPERSARTGIYSIRDVDEDREEECRDPRPDAGR